jgi:subfamily B ATP-binding cassette protein HlyB/CyaB
VATAEAHTKFLPVCYPARSREEAAPADESDAQPPSFGFRWFIPELFRYRKVWRDVVTASLFIQLLGLAMPLFTQVIIDKVIVHQTTSTLLVIATALIMFTVFTGVMTWVRQYLVLHTGNRVDAVLGGRVFSHLFRLPLKYFEQRPTGTLVARLEGVETIRNFLSGAAVTLVLDLPFLFIFLAVMFYYSWQLTLIVVGCLTAIALISLFVAGPLRRRLNEQFQLGARNQAFLTEYINGAETVKSLQMEPQMRQRFGDYLSSYLGAGFRTRSLFNTYNVAANTIEQVQMLTVLCVGAWIVMTTNALTVGMLVAFNMFASRLAQPVLRIVGLWQEFQQADVAVRRLGDIMDAPAEPYSLMPTRASGGQGPIRIEGLAFRYERDRPFLYENLNLTVEPGTALGIAGPSGCGKSTLAKLLQGFYQPTEGRITIDGRDIRQLAANELRAYFGVVPQETQLFSGSVYDNLIIANPRATFQQIVEACRAAEIHETIESLPEGYQTALGERGAGLSGGQKQRLAIARALLKRPKILIFDEATSGLDAATAERFAATVNKLKGRVTLLFITHQVPLGLHLDDVISLGGGSGLKPEAGVPDSRAKTQEQGVSES